MHFSLFSLLKPTFLLILHTKIPKKSDKRSSENSGDELSLCASPTPFYSHHVPAPTTNA